MSKFFKTNTTPKVDIKDDGPYSRAGYFRALSKVTFEVEQGELLSVLGHNGAGKSTLINIITGLLSGSDGKVFV